ncbi:MAG: tetratricopeptide repeat protein [Myxococcota bacterium]
MINAWQTHPDWQEGLALLQRGREAAEGVARAWLTVGIGHLLSRAGRFAEAERWLAEVDPDADVEVELLYHNTLGDVLNTLGRHEEARAHYDHVVRRARQVGQPEREAWALRALAFLDVRRTGGAGLAAARVTEALAVARGVGQPILVGHLLTGLGDLLWHAGRDAEAEATLREASALARRLGSLRLEGRALAALAKLREVAGDPGEAVRLLREALRVAELAHDHHGRSVARHDLAALHLALGRLDDAALQIEEALAVRRAAVAPALHAGVLALAAELAARRGDRAAFEARWGEVEGVLAQSPSDRSIRWAAELRRVAGLGALGDGVGASALLDRIEGELGDDPQCRAEVARQRAALGAVRG